MEHSVARSTLPDLSARPVKSPVSVTEVSNKVSNTGA